MFRKTGLFRHDAAMAGIVKPFVSIMSWLCLWAGLAIVALLATGERIEQWRLVEAKAANEAGELANLKSEVARLRRLTEAMKTDPLFRREWLRREWGLATSNAVESIPVERENALQPTETASEANRDPRLDRSTIAASRGLALFRSFDRGAISGVGFAFVVVGLLAPLMTRANPKPHFRRALHRFLARYRVDRPHEIAPPFQDVVTNRSEPIAAADGVTTDDATTDNATA